MSIIVCSELCVQIATTPNPGIMPCIPFKGFLRGVDSTEVNEVNETKIDEIKKKYGSVASPVGQNPTRHALSGEKKRREEDISFNQYQALQALWAVNMGIYTSVVYVLSVLDCLPEQ